MGTAFETNALLEFTQLSLVVVQVDRQVPGEHCPVCQAAHHLADEVLLARQGYWAALPRCFSCLRRLSLVPPFQTTTYLCIATIDEIVYT
jgi:hypothetical protein